MPRPPGCRTIDDATRREICAILSLGTTLSVAARYSGCTVEAIRREAFRDAGFRRQLFRARAQSEVVSLRRLHVAAEQERHWHAAAWTLERRHPDRYARRKARTVGREQLEELLAQFAAVLVDEITDSALRMRVLKKLRDAVRVMKPRPRK